jgi:membrane-bound serine protease (ClpP class)
MMMTAVFLGLIALGLIYVEFFVPGGILAILALAAALVGTVLISIGPYGWLAGVIYFVVLGLLSIVVCYAAIKKMKKSASKDSFFLSKDQQGYVVSSLDKNMIGKKGVAFSDLKPSGHIMIEGQAFQAVSERGYISKGAEVEIIALGPSYFIIKPLSI